MCIVVMFLIDYITALVTFLVIVALYIFVQHRKPGLSQLRNEIAIIYYDVNGEILI